MTAHRTLIIAEAGVNHNGSVETALDLVDAAADAGADIVKFQTFEASKLASSRARTAAYQTKAGQAGQSQLEMLRKLQLSQDDHRAILARCAAREIEFLSSPFDPDNLRFLVEELGLTRIKLGSGELTNGPLLLQAGSGGMGILLSTGMATLGEIEEALGAIAFAILAPNERPDRRAFAAALADPSAWPLLSERVTLLHCTTEYPAPDSETNLLVLDTLRQAFGLPVGYSDHSEGLAISLAAAARGATVLEKHFTLSRSLPGPDHAASLEPDNLADLVRQVRRIELALGTGIKQPGPAERRNRDVVRKSLVAARDLHAGAVLTEADITVKRPGDGLSPMAYWDLVGTRLTRDLKHDDLI